MFKIQFTTFSFYLHVKRYFHLLNIGTNKHPNLLIFLLQNFNEGLILNPVASSEFHILKI